MLIRAAAPHEAESLTDLAMRSKAHWGYSDDFMESCRAELTVNSQEIAGSEYLFYVAENEGALLGYYSLGARDGLKIELEALFVEPEFIGSGVGKALIQHALNSARSKGAKQLLIQGDPNAAEFYKAAGGAVTGERESESIPGRFLPTFQIEL